MDSLLAQVMSWPALVTALLVFGFAPGAMLRMFVLAFRRDDPRRTELLAELPNVPRVERPFWVFEQLEVALFEGLLRRLAEVVKCSRAPQRLRGLLTAMWPEPRAAYIAVTIRVAIALFPVFAAEGWTLHAYAPAGTWQVAAEALLGLIATGTAYGLGLWACDSMRNSYTHAVTGYKVYMLLMWCGAPPFAALHYGLLYRNDRHSGRRGRRAPKR